MRLNINHVTRYNYATPPAYALLQMRMRPQNSPVQKVHDWNMHLTGAQIHVGYKDQHSNLVDLVEIDPTSHDVEITVSGDIETLPSQGVKGPHTALMPLWFYTRQSALTIPGPGVSDLLDTLGSIEEDQIAGLHSLSAMIRERVAYTVGATGTETSAEAALSLGEGVCQDHTHIFLAAARQLGVPARYVSGYLMMNDRIDQQASHAWAEAHIQGLGWVGFDVSNGISPDERYVHICYGLDYAEAAPTFGILIGAQQENLSVSIQVQQ